MITYRWLVLGILWATASSVVAAPAPAPTKLSLADAVARALDVDEGYLSAREDVSAAAARIAEAKAALYPQVTFDASATQIWGLPTFLLEANSMGPGVPPEDVEFSAGYDRNVSAAISASQPLYQGGRAWTAYRAAKSYKSLADEGEREARVAVINDVARAYYDAVLADEAVRVADTSVAAATSHVQATEDRYNAGLVSEYDVLRTRVQLSNLETAQREAEDRRLAARRRLLSLLNLEPTADVALTDRLSFDIEVFDLADSLAAAKERRPELAKLDYSRRLAEENVKIARAGDNPSIRLNASYNEYANDFTLDFAHEWYEEGTLTLSVSWPLFDGFATRSRVRQARADLYKAEYNEARLKEALDMEVRGAYDKLNTAEDAVRTQKENVSLAERALEIAEARYEAGLMSNLEVLDAQEALTQARMGYYKALHAYAVAKIEMRRVRGDLEDMTF